MLCILWLIILLLFAHIIYILQGRCALPLPAIHCLCLGALRYLSEEIWKMSRVVGGKKRYGSGEYDTKYDGSYEGILQRRKVQIYPIV